MLPSYKSGLLQVKSHRILRNHVNAALLPFSLSVPEWSLLGALFEKSNLKLTSIASYLDVETPLITGLLDGLEKKSFLKRKTDPADRRSKPIVLTAKGQTLVPIVERALQETLKNLLKGLTATDMQTYQKVLEAIIKNDQKISSNKD